MKIVFLLKSFPCLSETFILNQITGLIDLGCDVKIIAFNKAESKAKQHAAVKQYKLMDKTAYITIPKSKAGKRIQTALRTLAAFVRYPLKIIRLQKELMKRFPAYDYQKFFLSMALLQQKDADVIHCHYGTMGNLAVISKDIGLTPKITTVFHGFDLSAYLIQYGQDVYQELFTKGDVFLPISEFWKDKLISLGCPKEKIIVMHMGINTAVFKPNNQKSVSSVIRVLTVARLTEKKGHRYALLALREAIRKYPQLEYHIAGDGPLMEDLKELTHYLKLENNVVFHGKVDMDEALRLYQEADIFLLPSITSSDGDMEGIPIVLMEAMACRLPVIASNHSGIPELVIDGQTGCIVTEKDTKMIKQRLVRLVQDLDLRQRLGQHARDHVLKSFNNSVLNKELLDLFFKLCHNRNG